MKTVYTAISLALLAAVAHAEVHTLPGSHRLPRDLGYGDTGGGHDFLGESLEHGDVVGDTFDHDFLGNGFNHPKHSDDSDDIGVPSFHDDDGDTDVGFTSSPIDSPSGGPHNFNQQGGPDTDSGHNEVDGGVNNDNIVITPVVAQQQAQAVEGEEHVDVTPPPHGGPPPHVEHQPEQLPPQQHSEPKQTETDTSEPAPSVEDTEPKQVSYQAPAAPAQNPAPTCATSQPKEVSYQAPTAPAQNPAPASAQPKQVAYQAPAAPAWDAVPTSPSAPAPAQSNSKPAPGREGETQEQEEESPCPESADGSHHMPMSDDVDALDNDDLESFPAPEVVHPQATPASDSSESEVTKPFPPGRQYEKPEAQAQVTPQSSFKAKASPVPSSVRYASYKVSGHSSQAPNQHTTSCTWTTTPAARVHQTPTPTVPSPLAAPSFFLGGAGFLAVPQGYVLAVFGALAFLL